MGMLDEILNSIQDSGAASDPGTQPAPGGSLVMSPIAKALIGLFAAYAAKNMGGMGGNMGSASSQPGGLPPGGQGGGLGDLLGSILGGGGAPGRSGPAGGSGGGGGGGLGDLLGGLLGGVRGPGRRSAAGLATCSNNSSRRAWATQRNHGSAPARTRRFRHRTSRARSAPIPSILCRSTPAWDAMPCSMG